MASLLVAVIAVWHVVSTYTVLSHTVDEPTHIAAGLEWYQPGNDRMKPENPPLAEVPTALGAYLLGHAMPENGPPFRRGLAVLYANDDYIGNLVRARLGTLPFFLLAIGLAWLWALRLGGPLAALLATAAFCTLPPIMGHAGLANTDAPFAAVFVLAIYTYSRWLDAPTTRRSIYCGIGLGLALAAKLSTLVFYPAAAFALLVLFLLTGRASRESVGWRPWLRGIAIVAGVSFVLLWAAYRFDVGTVAGIQGGPQATAFAFPNEGSLAGRLAELVSHIPCPAPGYFLGLFALYSHAAEGHLAYLLGEESQHGFWYFYLVALVVKTPLAFLFLVLAGLLAFVPRIPGRAWPGLAPAVAAGAIVLAALPSTINIGLRHLLPVYPLLAITGGVGLARLVRCARGRRQTALAILAGGLVVWLAALPFRVYPDYLAYFNPLAGDEPGEILIDSDLDWGQDLLQLRDFCAERDIKVLNIAYFGSVRLSRHGLPPLRWLQPGRRVTGWIAISEMYLRDHWHLTYPSPYERNVPGRYTEPGGYAWLAELEPVAIVGGSIRIYNVRED